MTTRQKNLHELTATLSGVAFVGSDAAQTMVSSLAFDSRKVVPGTLFIAVSGEKHDGHSFVRGAVESGAAAVVIQSGREAEFADLPIPCVVVPDTRRAMAPLAVAFYDNPTAKLHLAGVTGTNGKTTTALMMESIARAAGDKTAYVGTLGFGIDGVIVEGERTTPEAIDLQAFFARCVADGVTAVAIEVASHALVLGRTEGCLFDVAVFTNLTQDHLDFHGTMDAYRDAKGLLFTEYMKSAKASGKDCAAVINFDDEAGRTYALQIIKQEVARCIDYATTVEADIELIDSAVLKADSIAYAAHTPTSNIPVSLPFGGWFNVLNSLAAVGYGVARGLSPAVIAEGLRTCPPVPGRFQPVQAGQPYAVIVDYAHTPDGLDNVLRSARPLTHGNLITVFGCGGNRDKTKRPKMGRIARDLSDIAIVTSDNPRREDPEAILDDVLAGMNGDTGAAIYREADRRKAIALAVSLAKPGDTVVLAGKGHETYQIVGDETLPFDDVAVAREEIERCCAH